MRPSLTPPPGFQSSPTADYPVRILLPGYEALDPLAMPWKEMRRTPEAFPDVHVAKIASARTVVGLDVELADGRRERLYLKRGTVRPLLRRFLARFRASKEWRELLLAHDFLQAGITVPEPVYYSEAYDPDLKLRVTYLATRALHPEYREARAWFEEHRRWEEEWRSLARYTRGLHERGILHADYRADHLFLRPRDGQVEWALIDLDGSRLGAPIRPEERQRAFLQLAISLRGAGINPPAWRRFLLEYGITSSLRQAEEFLSEMENQQQRREEELRRERVVGKK